jgi:hypothetical protein
VRSGHRAAERPKRLVERARGETLAKLGRIFNAAFRA